MSMDAKLRRLEELNREAELGGEEERLRAQHAKGKLSARERVERCWTRGLSLRWTVRDPSIHRFRSG